MSTADIRARIFDQDMNSPRTLPLLSFLIYAILSSVDLFLTWFLLNNSNGKIYESNPIADAWLASYGWGGLIAYKVAGILLVAIVVLLISLRQPQTGKRLLSFAIVALILVTTYSYYLLVNTP
jgi:hypothetical protein